MMKLMSSDHEFATFLEGVHPADVVNERVLPPPGQIRADQYQARTHALLERLGDAHRVAEKLERRLVRRALSNAELTAFTDRQMAIALAVVSNQGGK